MSVKLTSVISWAHFLYINLLRTVSLLLRIARRTPDCVDIVVLFSVDACIVTRFENAVEHFQGMNTDFVRS